VETSACGSGGFSGSGSIKVSGSQPKA